MSHQRVTVVVLAGGRSSRFGSDKLAASLGDSTVLDTLLGALPSAWRVVVVGPRREVCRQVRFVRESPPGGGPLAGVAAALPLLESPLALVLAGDLPWAGAWAPRLVTALTQAGPEVDAVAATDQVGFANPLLAAYRTDALLRVMPGDPRDLPARLLLRELPHTTLAAPGRVPDDVDTPEDLPDPTP